MKHKLRNTLLLRMTIGQIIALMFITALAGWQFHNYFQYAADRAEQLSGWKSAERLAPYVKKILAEDHSYWDIQSMFHQMLTLSPKTELYILDRSGKVVADSRGFEHMINDFIPLEHIQKFLTSQPTEAAPLYGINPKDKSRKAPFSAAQFFVNGNLFYIYAIIANSAYENASIVSKVDAILRVSINSGFVLAAAAIVFGFILFYLLTNRLRKALTILSEFRAGDFSSRLPANGPRDEIGLLMETINSMADSIEDNISKLKHNDTLRRELIANIAHDLRSPTTLISGLSEVMLNEMRLPEPARINCKLVNDSCQSLNTLLSELFELAKFEAKETAPALIVFPIAELIEDIYSAYEPIASKKKVVIERHIEEQISCVIGDPGMLGRVLTNLIDNALRYTPPDGKISLSLKLTDKVQISITDTGVGIPEDELPHVFKRSYQVEHSSGSQNGLSGLGLAIVKKIVEAHGSNIEVSSVEGRGTTFTFELPIADSPVNEEV